MKKKKNYGRLAKLCLMGNDASAGYIAPWWLSRTHEERYPAESMSACIRQVDGVGPRLQQQLRV